MDACCAPARLTSQEVERLLATYEDGTANALRNRAMLLLLADLACVPMKLSPYA